MERKREPAWQDEILRAVPSGIDQAQFDAFQRLTPTERLEEMRQLLVQLEEARGLLEQEERAAGGLKDLTDLVHIVELRKRS